jgi:hypothetical protein
MWVAGGEGGDKVEAIGEQVWMRESGLPFFVSQGIWVLVRCR